MNHPHRSDRNLQSFARPGFVARTSPETGRLGALLAILCGFAFVGVMTGCKSGAASTTNTDGQTPLISIALTQSPPASMIAGNSAMVSATVANDIADAGVDWVATCASAPNCGSFNPKHTTSGATSIYTAPPGVPTKNTIAVTALSTTDRSKASSATVTITSTVTGVVISSPLPSSAPANAVLNLGATVAGDPANLGVDWVATCPTVNGPAVCSPSGLHSFAGQTVPFTIPETVLVPGTTQNVSLVGALVTITAFPTADHSFSASTMLTITAPIAVSISQAPPATMLTNATAPVIAMVTNDTTNSGVTWLVSCELAPCGDIAPTQTPSGVAAVFTAPPTVPSPNPPPGLAVTITAYATATNQTVLARATVNIIAPVSVSLITQINNSTIVVNATAPLVATVNNDPADAGVDWTVSCGSPGACGSFSPAHTASGASTTYTAPSAPPTGEIVTIAATSTSDTARSAQQIVTVTNAPPPNSLLQGAFVLFLRARNSQNGPFVLGGVISGDGNGNITTGKFDLADGAGNAEPANALPVLSPSTYSIGVDGQGQIQLTVSTFALNSNFGVPVPGSSSSTLTLSVVFVTRQHALLTEADTFGDAIGTLDLQNSIDLTAFGNGSAGLNGTYSLELAGTQFLAPHADVFVSAAITSQASGPTYTFTGYTADQSANGVISSVPFTAGSQSFPNAVPNVLGEIQLSAVNLGLPKQFSLDLWLIDANHFVVTDFIDASNASPVLIGGYLTAQPASPELSGTFAFTEAGATAAGQPQVAGGILTCGSGGTLDVAALSGTVLSNQSISATCSEPVNGRGLISISGSGSSGISQFAAYPTSDQGLYLIELDGGAGGTDGPSGAGVAWQQTLSSPISASALNGKYASSFSAATAEGSEVFAGQIISDGVSALSGNADVNSFNATAAPPAGTPSSNASLSGSFVAGSAGRFPLTLAITPANGQPPPAVTALNPSCYVVDANTCLLLGLDASSPGTGILILQNAGL